MADKDYTKVEYGLPDGTTRVVKVIIPKDKMSDRDFIEKVVEDHINKYPDAQKDPRRYHSDSLQGIRTVSPEEQDRINNQGFFSSLGDTLMSPITGTIGLVKQAMDDPTQIPAKMIEGLGDPLIKFGAGNVGGALGGAAGQGILAALPGSPKIRAFTEGASKGAVSGASTSMGYRGFKLPAPFVTGVGGEMMGRAFGHPELGAVAGTALPLVQGAIRGGVEASRGVDWLPHGSAQPANWGPGSTNLRDVPPSAPTPLQETRGPAPVDYGRIGTPVNRPAPSPVPPRPPDAVNLRNITPEYPATLEYDSPPEPPFSGKIGPGVPPYSTYRPEAASAPPPGLPPGVGNREMGTRSGQAVPLPGPEQGLVDPSTLNARYSGGPIQPGNKGFQFGTPEQRWKNPEIFTQLAPGDPVFHAGPEGTVYPPGEFPGSISRISPDAPIVQPPKPEQPKVQLKPPVKVGDKKTIDIPQESRNLTPKEKAKATIEEINKKAKGKAKEELPPDVVNTDNPIDKRINVLQNKENLSAGESLELSTLLKRQGINKGSTTTPEEYADLTKRSEPDEISHTELYKLADSLGVQATPLARHLTSQGWKVQPSKFGTGKWGVERMNKGDVPAGLNQKELAKYLDLMGKVKSGDIPKD